MSDKMRTELSRITPYDDDYATCERTLAALRIYADNLDPDMVTDCLGIRPTSSQRKGEIKTNSRGKQRTIKIGAWFLSSEDRVQSKDLRRHLDWLLALVLPRAEAVRSLQTIDGVTMNVNCIWWSARGGGGPTLWPEQMRGLADLNLECSFDVSFYDEEENGKPKV